MKTKHLLTALALPAVFAACTAEDIVTEGASQAQRVALNENFKLDFGGVESRLSAGEPGEAFAFDFEKGDLVGGAIIDSYTGAQEPTTGTAFEKIDAVYSTQYFVSANQPFKFDGSDWTLEHTMVEGKYLFYYPYNTENNSRGAAKYSIPVMQDLSDKTTGKFNPKAAIEKYSMAVGYQFLDEEDLSASVELAPIFSYARVVMTLDNQYAGGEIEKIVLESKGNEFKLNGQLDNKEIEKIFRAKATGKEADGTTKFDWDNYNTTVKFELPSTATPFYNEDFNKGSNVIVGKVPAGTKMTKDAQNNHTFETYLVVPAQAMTGNIVAYLYTTDGKIYSNNVEYKNNLTFNRNTPKKLTVNLEANIGAVPYVIASQEDWNNSVSMLSKDETAEFIIADEKFAIDNESKFPKNAKIIVDKVAVSGNNVTMKNIYVKEELTVNKGVKLNADATLAAKKIVNEGEVVFAEIPEVESKAALTTEKLNKFIAANYWISEIENEGTLTIENDAKLTSYQWSINATTDEFEVTNEPVELGLKLDNKKGGIVSNAGTITIWGSNEGTITNTGAINIFEGVEATTGTATPAAEPVKIGFTNEAREYGPADEDGNKEVINEPKIDNAATGEIRATVGDLTNKSLIVNAGILSCGNNEGLIKNDKDGEGNPAVIDAKANSITLISTSENGKVIVYALKQANMAINDGKGIVEYTANADINIDGSNVTNVIATASIKITQGSKTDDIANGALKNLKVTADATITVVAPEDNAFSFTSIEVAEGKKMTLGSSLKTTELIVNEKASVVVPVELTLEVTGDNNAETGVDKFVNEGTIVVTGILKAENILKEQGGVVLDNGGTGSIFWELEGDKLALSTAKTAYETAMKTAVAEYALAGAETGAEFFGFNLNDSLTAWTNVAAATAAQRGAANYFEASRKNGALKTAYDEYLAAFVKVNPNATDAQKPKFLDYYASAVNNYITTVKATAAYTTDLKDYKIAVPAATADEVNFFVATKRASILTATTATDNVTVSAETNALNAFKAKIAADNTLDVATRVVLCSEGTYSNISSYIPDYVFAFESNNAYKLWKNHIAKNQSAWNIPTTLSGFTAWVKGVADWTESVLATKGADEKLVHAFIVDNNYAVYLESTNWKYTDKTIAEMLSFAKEELNITVTTQP